MGRQPSAAAKRRIVDAALEAFNAEGIKAVSADTIIDRAGVAKMTLYKYFPTKEALAVAYVRERNERWMAWLRSRALKAGRTPIQRLLALFDALEDWFNQDDYFGCPFHRSAAEFPAKEHPVHQEVIRNKQQLREFVRQLVIAADFSDPAQLTNQLMALMAGAEVMANIEYDPKYARLARQAAARLIVAK